MHDTQVARLRAKFPKDFTVEQAAQAVARAYGYRKLDLNTLEMSDPIGGLQYVKSYKEMLGLDPSHQTMEFIRMALNLSLSANEDVRQGVPERMIVAAIMGFQNFDDLMTYARSDPVDPNTTDRAMLAKFQTRYGYYAPIQYVLGLDIHDHCLIMQPDAAKAQRFVDQEILLNPLKELAVVIVRDDPHGGDFLKIMSKDTAQVKGEFDSEYESKARAAFRPVNAMVSILEPQVFSLYELVSAHKDMLTIVPVRGRALIVDVEKLSQDTNDLDKAFALASENSIHVVVIVREPNADLWKRTAIRVIFGFDKDIQESDLEMDTFIGYSAPYVGFKRGKMQYLYHSEKSGPRFGAMDLIPDEPETKSLLQRMRALLG